ncbi:hypothetical protein ACFE04_004726 [Oxalis oulophora]
MSAPPLTPAKRQFDNRTAKQTNGKRKWKKSASGHSNTSKADTVVFRLLCPSSKTGSIIGKGGAIITHIREQTGVNIKVEENVPGCDERVIIVSGSEKESEVVVNAAKCKEIKSEVGADGNLTDKIEEADVTEKTDSTEGKSADVPETTEEVSETKDGEDEKKLVEKDQSNQNDEDEGSHDVEGSSSLKENLQKALLLVFERIVIAEPETEESSKSSGFVLRLLVLSNQVGSLLGKAGSIVKQLSATSGAQIRVLPKDKFPLCASASDEVVQITGEVDSVRKALQAVSLQLMEKSVSNSDFPSTTSGPSEVHPSNQSLTAFHPSTRHVMPKFHEGGLHSRMKIAQEIFTVRVVCPEEKVGSIIGIGGAIVRSIQQDTGCEIKVVDEVFDAENRIIAISGPVHPGDRISAVQDAVFRVLTRISMALPGSIENNNTISARLLVSSYLIGCLLGKGGSIIAEMRKSSGAYIRKLPKDQIPKHLLGEEEVVQITGGHEAFEEAILQITARLQHDFFREAFPTANHHPLNPPFLGQAPSFHSFTDRREFSPSPMYPHGPPYHGGLHPHGGFHPHDEQPPFMQDFRRPGISPLMSERNPWGPQGVMEDGGPLGVPEFAGATQRRILDVGGSNPPIIKSTTVEVVVPSDLVPVIYGEDGFCLNEIRQWPWPRLSQFTAPIFLTGHNQEISDANIVISDPKPGARETVIVISGTPEETNAAQSLIQAFVMSETESS